MSVDSVEESKAPLISHLIELRTRLLWCLVAMGIAFVICFYFADNIYNFLLGPYEAAVGEGQVIDMQFTAPHEFFFTQLKMSLFGAFVLSFPLIALQIYKFIAPGLYENERHAFLPYLIATPLLFLIGAAVVYYLVMPLALGFFLSTQQTGDANVQIKLVARVSEYFSFVMTLILAFGLCFQLPVVLTLLGKAGLVSSDWLKTKRRYAIVAVFAAAAILTPPDPLSQLGLALPTYLLYEFSIWMVMLVEKKRTEKEV
jgi:sec-independent protein translocase protein TatC